MRNQRCQVCGGAVTFQRHCEHSKRLVMAARGSGSARSVWVGVLEHGIDNPCSVFRVFTHALRYVHERRPRRRRICYERDTRDE